MLRAIILTFAAALFSGTAVQADDLTASGQAGLEVCIKHFADFDGTVEALKANGWNYHGSDGMSHTLTLNGKQMMMVAAKPFSGSHCTLMIEDMTTSEANDLAAAIALQHGMTESELMKAATGRTMWEAKVNGRNAAIMVTDPLPSTIQSGMGAMVHLIDN